MRDLNFARSKLRRCNFDNEWTWRDGFQTLLKSSKPLQDRGRRARSGRARVSVMREIGPRRSASGLARDQEGRLSNPVQRRLSEHDVDEIVSAYLDGSSIDSLAKRVGSTGRRSSATSTAAASSVEGSCAR